MRSRSLALVAVAMFFAACTAGTTQTGAAGASSAASSGGSSITSPIASVGATAGATTSASASAAPVASKAGAPSITAAASKAAAIQSPEASDPAYNIETVTLICLTDGGGDPSANLTSDVCSDILDATLTALGSRASSVVRAEVGFVCAAADKSCADDAIVGFKDGHLEGASVDWQQEDAPFDVGTFHALAATAWPWGTAATYTAPPASLPTLPIAPTPELAKRTPLPYCGLLTADDATTTAGAEKCFGNAIRTGHAAEIDTEFGNDPYAETVDRFVGSGPIVETSGTLPASRKGGSWNAGTTPVLIILDPDGSVTFGEFGVTDVSPVE